MNEKLEQHRRDLHEIAMRVVGSSRSRLVLLRLEAERYGLSLDEFIEVLRDEAERPE